MAVRAYHEAIPERLPLATFACLDAQCVPARMDFPKPEKLAVNTVRYLLWRMPIPG
jgi:hypothetical protein